MKFRGPLCVQERSLLSVYEVILELANLRLNILEHYLVVHVCLKLYTLYKRKLNFEHVVLGIEADDVEVLSIDGGYLNDLPDVIYDAVVAVGDHSLDDHLSARVEQIGQDVNV